MPLPQPGTNWPPAPFGPAFAQYELNAAWLEGNTELLNRIYTGGTDGNLTGWEHRVNGQTFRGGLRGLRSRWFNGRPVTAQGGTTVSETRIHAPLAADVATLSADLVMSEPPKIRMLKDNDAVEGPAQEALDRMMNSDEARINLRRGFEWAAGVSACAFTWAWAPGINDGYPWLQAHAADTVIPQFTSGRLTSLLVVDTYPLAGDGYLRHIMSHDVGTITHGLFYGRVDKLGDRIGFDAKEVQEFAPHLTDLLAAAPQGAATSDRSAFVIATGIDRLTAAFVLNKPTTSMRREGLLSYLGRADIEGAEPFLDAHDEAWSSLMRDMKLGRGRLVVDQSMLDGLGAGLGASFDDLQELFSPIQAGVMGGVDSKIDDLISNQQFDIRVEQHLAITRETAGVVYDHAGYAPASYGAAGAAGDTATTATDAVDRSKKSERTRDAKLLYARSGLREMSLAGLDLTNVIPGVKAAGVYRPEDLDIQFPEVSQIDPEKDARTYSTLRGASIISRYLSVKRRNPDFTESEVKEEVKRIEQENQSVGVSPFSFGAPTDPLPPEADPNVDPNNGANDAGAQDQSGSAAPAGA